MNAEISYKKKVGAIEGVVGTSGLGTEVLAEYRGVETVTSFTDTDVPHQSAGE